MAVRNASNITLLEVINEINPTDRSLAGCIAKAKKTGWMSSYMGSRNRLSNFRGYSHGSLSYY